MSQDADARFFLSGSPGLVLWCSTHDQETPCDRGGPHALHDLTVRVKDEG